MSLSYAEGRRLHPSLELFTLDDVTEGMELENLTDGFTVVLEALN